VTTQGLRYTLAALAVAALVVAAGLAFVDAAYRGGVLAGAGIGVAVQVAAFWIFAVWLYPGRMWHGYGLGMLARFAAFAAAAFLVVPRAGLPMAATLFSLVGVFWLTTLVEPVFLKTRTSNPTQA
jgi:hypothetical protein